MKTTSLFRSHLKGIAIVILGTVLPFFAQAQGLRCQEVFSSKELVGSAVSTIQALATLRLNLDQALSEGSRGLQFKLLKKDYNVKEAELLKFMNEKQSMSITELRQLIRQQVLKLQGLRDQEVAKDVESRAQQAEHLNPLYRQKINLENIPAGKISPEIRAKIEFIQKYPLHISKLKIETAAWNHVAELAQKRFGDLYEIKQFEFIDLYRDEAFVENVAWGRVQIWIRALNHLSALGDVGLKKVLPDWKPGDIYRMPTWSELALATAHLQATNKFESSQEMVLTHSPFAFLPRWVPLVNVFGEVERGAYVKGDPRGFDLQTGEPFLSDEKTGFRLLRQAHSDEITQPAATAVSTHPIFHRLHFTRSDSPFYMLNIPTTQKIYEQIAVIANQSLKHGFINPQPSRFMGDSLPVENVYIEDRVIWLKTLNELSKAGDPLLATLFPDYQKGDEYYITPQMELQAAVAVSKAEATDQTAWLAVNSGGETHPVGSLNPHYFDKAALYDLFGNGGFLSGPYNSTSSPGPMSVHGGTFESKGNPTMSSDGFANKGGFRLSRMPRRSELFY